MSAEDLPDAGQAVLDRVREYRTAARKIVEAEWATVKRRCLGLLELQDAARAEPDLTVRTWAERAVWEEAKPFLGVGDGEPVAPPRSYEAAQRKLRNQQLERCPTCHASLATEQDFARWARIRKADAERRGAREKAVGP
jgi:hypothetical protein